MRVDSAGQTTIHVTPAQAGSAGNQAQAAVVPGSAHVSGTAAAVAAVRPRPDFQRHTRELQQVGAQATSSIFWTTPWHLAHEDLPEMQRLQAWPNDLFTFFLDAVQDTNIIEADGAHAFFEVLHEYQSMLSPGQRAALEKALHAPVLLKYPAWVASCRLKELFAGQAAMEQIVRDSLSGRGAGPISIGNAIALFDTFKIVSTGPSSTRCSVSTAISGKWEFTVDFSYLKLQTRRPPDLTYRDDLITSQFATGHPLNWLEDTIAVLPAYNDKRRNDTLLGVPAALADTQALMSEEHGWDPGS